MLKNVKMTNWRMHEDRTISFTAGLNSIRGANEKGKSSMLLAVVYALWGKKALPLPLEEVVTWGKEVKSLAVEVTLELAGVEYTFTRSESGAEVLVGGEVKVTGQTGVSDFASEKFGMDHDQASKIMFAPQSALRGALEEGPKEIAQYIERLSGMDLFDELLELASNHWVTGPTKTIDTQIADINLKLKLDAPVPVNYEDIDDRIVVVTLLNERAVQAQAAAEKELSEANRAEASASAQNSLHTRHMTTLRSLRASLKEKLNLVESYKDDIAAAEGITQESILILQRSIEEADGASSRRKIYDRVQELCDPDAQWVGNRASLEKEIETAQGLVIRHQQRIAVLDGDIREAKAQVVQGSICGFCQQDYSQFPEVASRNASLLETISSKESEKSQVAGELDSARDSLNELKAVLASNRKYDDFLYENREYVEVDLNFVPPNIKWKGEVPSAEPVDVAPLRKKLKDHEAKFKALSTAAMMAPVVMVDVNKLEAQVAEAEANIPPEVDTGALALATSNARQKVNTFKGEVATNNLEIKDLQLKRERLKSNYENAVSRHHQLKEELEALTKRREEQVFNNNLLKKIRAARPKVAARLWEIVLTAASQMFSSMRGEMSIITKTDKTFLVNGQSYLGLSGSALDLMGLSIRTAMQKTFVPHISFMLGDEPTAACDADRTAAMLGFLASADFDQIILVTHSPMVDAVADNLITI